MEISTIGLDLAKSVFQVHAIDAAGVVVVRKALRRSQVLAPIVTLRQNQWRRSPGVCTAVNVRLAVRASSPAASSSGKRKGRSETGGPSC